MPAEPATAPAALSLWNMWAAGAAHLSAFASARAALAALLADRGVRRIWLPAYVCTALAEGAAEVETRLYPIGRDLRPDLAALATARPGDAVVAVSYVGRAPGPDLRGLARQRPDLLWIDDRAQALAPEAGRWAEVTLYSPRKLVGVGDGGLLVSDHPLPAPKAPPPAGTWAPERARALDPDGLNPDAWYPLFQAREAAVSAGSLAVSAATVAALKAIDPTPIMQRRKANWRVLARHVANLALITAPQPAFTPVSYPITVRDPAALVRLLADQGIYCPRHWSDLPVGAQGDAVWLSEHQVSLPLDQRYDEGDMIRIADAVLAQAR